MIKKLTLNYVHDEPQCEVKLDIEIETTENEESEEGKIPPYAELLDHPSECPNCHKAFTALEVTEIELRGILQVWEDTE